MMMLLMVVLCRGCVARLQLLHLVVVDAMHSRLIGSKDMDVVQRQTLNAQSITHYALVWLNGRAVPVLDTSQMVSVCVALRRCVAAHVQS